MAIALADAVPVMLWTTDAGGVCNFFNARLLAFAGLGAGELAGQRWIDLAHPHDRTRRARRHELALQRQAAFVLESRLRGADGEWRWVREEAVPTYGAAGRFTGIAGCAFDITEEREAQAGLVRRLASLQELERRNISADLHDRAGEPLTALRIQLAALLRERGLGDDVRKALERCIGFARRTVDAVSDVMSELRPPMLDDFGLAAALRWYAEHVTRGAELDVVVSAPQEPPRLPLPVEVALFRIAQECLRNVVRHARASHADVALSHEGGGEATLRIEDDGVGFAQRSEPPSRWGLLTMRERAAAIDAHFDVVSRPGAGTCITVTLGG